MKTIFSLLLLALAIGNALAAPAAISRPHWQEQTGDLDPFRADLAASTAALQSVPPASDSMLAKTYVLAKRAEAAMIEADITHVDVLPRNGDTHSERVSAGYANRGARGRRLSPDSDVGGEEVTTRSPDDLLPDDEGLLLGREPRQFGKRLGIALGGGASGAMMAQLGQALILGVDPIPLKSKRSLHDVRDFNEEHESTMLEKRIQFGKRLGVALGGGAFGAMMAQLGQALILGVDPIPVKSKRSLHDVRGFDEEHESTMLEKRIPPSFFDALARKLFEKFFTSGGGGVIYQPLRYKFRKIFGKAQHGHT